MRTLNLNLSIGRRIGRLINATEQYKLGRIVLGGMYVKVNGYWNPCHVVRIESDGTRFLCFDDDTCAWFHETFGSVEAIEEHA